MRSHNPTSILELKDLGGVGGMSLSTSLDCGAEGYGGFALS